MQQFFVNQRLVSDETLCLPIEVARQCRLVLRYADGQIVRLVGIDGTYALASLSFKEQLVFAHVQEVMLQDLNHQIQITLIQGLIRKERWEYFLQKATEVGVYRIVPLILERNVVKWDREDSTTKMTRYRKIIQEAAEQSLRTQLPILEEPITLKELENYRSDLNFIAYELESSTALKSALDPCSSVSIVIGSEGGISPFEHQKCRELGFKSVHLGPRILRTETAGLVACTIIQTVLEP